MLTWADTHTWWRICRNPAFLRGDSSTPLEEIICEFGHRGGSSKRNVPSAPLTQGNCTGLLSSSTDLSSRGREEQSVIAWLLQCAGHSWRKPLPSSNTKGIEVGPPWLGGGRRSGKRRIRDLLPADCTQQDIHPWASGSTMPGTTPLTPQACGQGSDS